MSDNLKITRLETQKKNKNRVSVFVNDEFAFGADLELIRNYGLQEGSLVTRKLVDEILLKDTKKRIKEKAFRYLAGRAHSEKELKTKLAQKGFDAKLIEEVIMELKSKNFIDDESFAFSYVRSRLIHRPAGERLLRQELWQKGIHEEIINRVLQKVFNETPQAELAQQLVVKLNRRYQNLEENKKRKRIYEFLIRRGFDWELVKEVVDKEFV
ncbi:MAG: regulatory protein RecX [Calditrichaeota bacterium]|nr:MAG: regulatory protein RecX [Calditrichota bacterium]